MTFHELASAFIPMRPDSLHSLFSTESPRLPVYFISHGAPTFMYPDEKFCADPGAYRATQNLGKYIREVIKPNFILVVSAHWQSNKPGAVEIAVPATLRLWHQQGGALFQDCEVDVTKKDPLENELIYDFYGFPTKMYEEEFHSRSSMALANDIADTINNARGPLRAMLTERGIDHGVWVPLKVAFSGSKYTEDDWDVTVPLVQISLAAGNDFKDQYTLGQLLARYRDLGGLILTSGMVVHNLRDLLDDSAREKSSSYTTAFHWILSSILVTTPSDPCKLSRLIRLCSTKDEGELLHSAHPTLEHFLPIIVGLGAGEGLDGPDKYTIKELYQNDAPSLGWSIYQYGTYPDSTFDIGGQK
ncbi:AaceriABR198Cp [[Ashbya] aceris (nom. inval.)]|nr:AaceriABR198Cp [[Ashbya] aceris (nom. inval.)]